MVLHEPVAGVVNGVKIDRRAIPRLALQQVGRSRMDRDRLRQDLGQSCSDLSFAWSTSSNRGTKSRSISPGISEGRTRGSESSSSSRAGATMPGSNGGSAASGSSGTCWKWFDTVAPGIGSAGYEGHQPTTTERFPSCARMFHNALVLRDSRLHGRIARPSPVGSEKPSTPCLGGRLPVAIEVHRVGLKAG
jgi:hypothetical protein